MIEIIETGAGGAGRHALSPRERALLADYGRLRKRRFHDELGWDVRLAGDEERDRYDDAPAIYVLAVGGDERWDDAGEDGTRALAPNQIVLPDGDAHAAAHAAAHADAYAAPPVRGGLRLMPTTGPTLLHDVFGVLMDEPNAFRAPGTWEITRFCLCPASPRAMGAVTRALFAALLDLSRARDIDRHVAVTDPVVRRLLRLSGLRAREVSHDATTFGCPVTLWDWRVDAAFAATVERESVLHGIARRAIGLRVAANANRLGATVAEPGGLGTGA